MNSEETTSAEQEIVEVAQEAPGASEAPARAPLPRSFAIDLRPEVLDEIAHKAVLAFSGSGQGGMEIGGVLLGSLARRTIRVESWVPVSCEHSYGPGLVLSDADRAKLRDLLSACPAGTPEGAGPIGWVVSRADGEPRPSDADIAVFGEFFPEPWHVLVVVQPLPADAPRAAVYLRGPDGTLNPWRAYREIDLRPKQVHRSQPVRANGSTSLMALDARAAGAAVAAGEVPRARDMTVIPSAAPAEGTEPPRVPRSPLRWAWLALPAAAMGIGIAVFVWLRPAEPEPLPDITLSNAQQELLVRWSIPPELMNGADSGALRIGDGGVERTIRLTPTDLKRGSLTWTRQSGDVRVNLMVWGHGRRSSGFAEFVGPTPATLPQMDHGQSDDLKQENAALRAQAARAGARAAAAENLVRILENRLAIEGSAGAARH